MARILLLTPQLPYPAEQGTSLRNLNILRGLSLNHVVTLLSFGYQSQDLPIPAFGPLEELCDSIWTVPYPVRSGYRRLISLISDSRPDMAHRLQSEAYTTSLHNLLANDKSYDEESRQFDIVQIEGIEMAEEIPLIRQKFPTCKIVYDAHNAETELQRRAYLADRKSPGRWHAAAYSWIQTRRLLQFEANTCKMSDWVTAVSDLDASFLRALAPETRISIIPNCINVADYQQNENESTKKFDILFSGKMDYRPNVDAVLWFAEEVWPLIVRARPNTTWGIVGQKPHKRLSRVGRLNGVTIVGRVEHVQPYMAGASIYILPFRMGSGTRLKLIEAMASGMAVVSTTLGAQGYGITGGKELILADSALEFSKATLELLNDSQSRQPLGREARAFAKQYDWRLIIPKFDEIYRQL